MRSIDIHAHLTPQCFWKATENGGDWHTLKRDQDSRGREIAVVGNQRGQLPPKASWTPEQRLSDMDSLGVDVQVVSPYSGFYNYHLDSSIALSTSKESNEEVAQMAKTWPDRFAGLGTLPMQDIAASITELDRIMSLPGFKGVMINDQINGEWLDDPKFLPFWKSAEASGAMILFHQGGDTLVSSRIGRYHLPNAIGNLADRTVNFASLVMGGVMDACPDLKICLSHGGGYICHGIGRIDRSWETRVENRVNAKQAPSSYLNRFYYDCIVYTERSLRYLIDTVGAERVVFGTDWPYDMALDWPVSWILSMESITYEEKEQILSKNLENLLGI